MKKIYLFIFIIQILHVSTLFAQTPEITNGISYLTATQNPDGSWGDETSITEVFPLTVSAIEALKSLNETSSQNYTDAVTWLENQDIDTTDYLSERIHALSNAGSDLDLVLSYIENIFTGAWGGYLDFEPNVLDTALTILALKEINHSDLNIISYALFYLTNNQNSDGGWGFGPEDASAGSAQSSNVYITSLVLNVVVSYKDTFLLDSVIDDAVSYLLSKQNPDGGFPFISFK
jgi:prenyltransferase beta subunit